MDLQAEYKEFFDELGQAATYTYKFFELFKVNLGNGEDTDGNKLVKGLHWSKDCSDEELTDEQLRELKSYLKQVKVWIRKEKNRQKSQNVDVECGFFFKSF
jgi:transcriptional regulator of heat shock response